MDIEKLKKEIVERLKPLNPEKIILFGSYAYGNPHEDSDVDLYVVTSDDFMPDDWNEKNNIFLRYSKKVRDLQRIIPIDLIVHTKPMYEKLKLLNSSFFVYEISEGIDLL